MDLKKSQYNHTIEYYVLLNMNEQQLYNNMGDSESGILRKQVSMMPHVKEWITATHNMMNLKNIMLHENSSPRRPHTIVTIPIIIRNTQN